MTAQGHDLGAVGGSSGIATIGGLVQPAALASGRRGWIMRRMLLAADVVGLLGAFALAEILFVDSGPSAVGVRLEVALFLASLPLWVVVAKVYGLYDKDEERADHSTIDEVAAVFHLVTVVVWAFYATTWLTNLTDPDPAKLGTFWLFAIAAMSLARAGARVVVRRHPAYVQRALIIGAGDVGQLVGRKIVQHPEYGIDLVGYVDADPREPRGNLGTPRLVGSSLHDLPEIVRALRVDRVIIAFSRESHEDVLEIARTLNDLDVQVDVVPRLFEIVSPSMQIHAVEGVPLIGVPRFYLSRSSRLLKRGMDVSLSLAALVVLSPVLVLIALAIRLDSRGPVLFRQLRMGSDDAPFRILKFRTMTVDAEELKPQLRALNRHHETGDTRMFKVPNDPRITRVGRVLRRFSLDELPQLMNVLRGEMSLVGPRPLVLDEDEHVLAWGRKRLNLKPGMTGLWQVLGRHEIPFEEMVKLDYLYVTTWSLGQDVKLLFRTVPSILRSRDVV